MHFERHGNPCLDATGCIAIRQYPQRVRNRAQSGNALAQLRRRNLALVGGLILKQRPRLRQGSGVSAGFVQSAQSEIAHSALRE